MTLAGISVRRELVEWLAINLAMIQPATGCGVRLTTTRALSASRFPSETILRALEDPPDGLMELRATLLLEHVARVRGELA